MAFSEPDSLVKHASGEWLSESQQILAEQQGYVGRLPHGCGHSPHSLVEHPLLEYLHGLDPHSRGPQHCECSVLATTLYSMHRGYIRCMTVECVFSDMGLQDDTSVHVGEGLSCMCPVDIKGTTRVLIVLSTDVSVDLTSSDVRLDRNLSAKLSCQPVHVSIQYNA